MPEETTAPPVVPARAALAALLAVLLVALLCLPVLVAAPAGVDRAGGPGVVSAAAAGSDGSPAQAPRAAAGPVEVADDLPVPPLPDAPPASLQTGCPATSCSHASLPVAVETSLPDPD